MKKEMRRQILNFRTTGISEDMYAHIEEKTKDRSFREYATELISREMNEESQMNQIAQVLAGIRDEMVAMKRELTEKIEDLEKKLDERTVVQGEAWQEPESPVEDELTEGQLVTVDIETKAEIDRSEFEMDF